MPVPPAAVWDALADLGGYGYWVPGSKVIRDADPEWPAPGSRFHHTIGLGPIKVSDHTVALDSRPPELLRLRAKGRPLGTATITLELTPRDAGTVVRISETLDGPYVLLNLSPLVHLATKGRNASR
jgi:carbon monoxide dehydrogenase subunit G